MNKNQSITFAKGEAEEIRRLLGKAVENIIEIGRRLIAVKAALKHGEWGEYLHQEFDWSERTAQNFMNVSERFKNENFADLKISPSVLYLLAAPSTPEDVREEILNRARSGERITHSAAKAAMGAAKNKLTDLERKDLADLESKIERDIDEFSKACDALVTIRDERLYRGEYKTFEDYCRKELEISPSMLDLFNGLFPPAGHPRSEADERLAVSKMLNDDEWRRLSNEEIAQHCGVDVSLVEVMRAETAFDATKTEFKNWKAYAESRLNADDLSAKECFEIANQALELMNGWAEFRVDANAAAAEMITEREMHLSNFER